MIWEDCRDGHQAPLCDGAANSPLRYRVREHPRAKHVRLKLSWLGTLEIVVPRGYNRRHLPAVIEAKREWLSVMRRRLRSEMSGLAPELFNEYPQRIALRALEQVYRVSYEPAPQEPKPTMNEEGARLIVRGAGDAAEVAALLRNWLKIKARAELLPRLQHAARRHGFRYSKGSIRGQNTRWGSCSARGTISLNYKLLFVPRELVNYLLVHELAHTAEFNHSERYWRLVESCLPNAQRLDRALSEAWRYVPFWAGA